MARDSKPLPVKRSILSTLRVVNIKRSGSVNIVDPVVRGRTKIIEAIKEQIKHVEAEIRGEVYNPMRSRYVDGPNGTRIIEEAPKRRMIWYWPREGRYYTEVRYGSSPLNFGSGLAIDCGESLTDVIKTLRMLMEASDAGELDEELARIAAQRSRYREVPHPEPTDHNSRIQQRNSRR